MLGKLKKKLCDHLGNDLVRQYTAPWVGIPLEESSSNEAVKKYLQTFCADFVTEIEQLIDRSVTDDGLNFVSPDVRMVYHEVLLAHFYLYHSKMLVFIL